MNFTEYQLINKLQAVYAELSQGNRIREKPGTSLYCVKIVLIAQNTINELIYKFILIVAVLIRKTSLKLFSNYLL